MTFSQFVEICPLKKHGQIGNSSEIFQNGNVEIQLEIGESDLRNLFRDANSESYVPSDDKTRARKIF